MSNKPKIYCGIICRNEERDIPRAIKSIVNHVDGLIVIDTGSTDNTLTVARDAWPSSKPFHCETYLGASEIGEDGKYRLASFSQARNRAIQVAEDMSAQNGGPTHYIWLDADDELLDGDVLARSIYRNDVDTYAMFCEAGGSKWLHQRVWKLGMGVRFFGRCHEYPKIDGLRNETMLATIRHHADPDASQEDSNARNLRLLTKQWGEDGPDTRTAFYLACTHKDAGRHADAAHWFERRISLGVGYRDEYLFAMLYRARAEAAEEWFESADSILADAIKQEPTWAEFWIARAQIAYAKKDWKTCIKHAKQTLGMPIPPTALWRETWAYKDGGPRLISWCYEHLEDIDSAIEWSYVAHDLIGGHDQEWEQRHVRLVAMLASKGDPAPKIVTQSRKKVAFVRPGAIGDILMTLNLVQSYKAANPDTDVHFFCAHQYASHDALLPTMLAAGIDLVLDSASIRGWAANYDQIYNLVGYPLHEGYPDKPMARHLLEYFGAELGLAFSDLPSARIKRPKKVINGKYYITIQRNAGWSKYKELPNHIWDYILASLPQGLKVVEIGDQSGLSLNDSISVIANSSLHLGIDSFSNHLTHYLWQDGDGEYRRVPGVIVWGSSQTSASGYPTNTNISLDLPCQPCFRENPEISNAHRGLCPNTVIKVSKHEDGGHACMSLLSVDDISKAVQDKIDILGLCGKL